MKKLVLASLALFCAASVFAQGQVYFNNVVTGLRAPVYGVSPVSNLISQHGNGATGTPAGTTDWTGYPVLSGSTYMAALMYANGADAADAALKFSPTTTTFRTGTAVGFIAPQTITLDNTVGIGAAAATFQVFAWDNTAGTFSDPAAAWTAWQAGTIAGGASGKFNLLNIGGGANPPSNLDGLRSFNLYMAVPEPSTMALAGLGAAAMLIFRRRK